MFSEFEDGGYRDMCFNCGSPVVTKHTKFGSKYSIAVAEDQIRAYFTSRHDIDEYLHDRLGRAEQVIVELKKELGLRTRKTDR